MLLHSAWLILIIAASASAQFDCSGLSAELQNEIRTYAPIVNQIVAAAKNGSYSGIIYNDLTDFLDEFGFRLQGTPQLELAIDNVIERQRNASLVVSTQNVTVSSWTRGEESAELITPRRQKISILSLGSTISTPPEGITAPVVVVKDFDELERKKDEVRGRIVLFNVPFTTYGQTAVYRNTGPNAASKLGASAVLVRSVTYFSLYTPHTGNTQFEDPSLRIPAAAITLEDADLIARLAARGKNVTVKITTSSVVNSPVQSRNVIGDIVGASKPNEFVVISGHIDSWDVGQGALDDGGGAFLAWHSLALIKKLGLKPPARTIRSILWTAEESGLMGANAYKAERLDEIKNWSVAFESDEGVFNAQGVGFSGSDDAACILQEVTLLLKSINGSTVNRQSSAGSDIDIFPDLGIPIGEPFNPPNDYFTYHHTPADYINGLKSEDLDQTLAIFASTIYVLADISVSLSKDASSPSPKVFHPGRTENSATTLTIPSISLMLIIFFLFSKFRSNL